jgi:hypothetical protein
MYASAYLAGAVAWGVGDIHSAYLFKNTDEERPGMPDFAKWIRFNIGRPSISALQVARGKRVSIWLCEGEQRREELVWEECQGRWFVFRRNNPDLKVLQA